MINPVLELEKGEMKIYDIIHIFISERDSRYTKIKKISPFTMWY